MVKQKQTTVNNYQTQNQMAKMVTFWFKVVPRWFFFLSFSALTTFVIFTGIIENQLFQQAHKQYPDGNI